MKKMRIKILSLIFIALITIAVPSASSSFDNKTTKADLSNTNTNDDKSALNNDLTNTNNKIATKSSKKILNPVKKTTKPDKIATKSDKKLLMDLQKVIKKLNKLNPKSDYLKAKNTITKLETIIKELQSRGYDVYLDEKNLRLVLKSPNQTVTTNETIETENETVAINDTIESSKNIRNTKILAAAAGKGKGGGIGPDNYYEIGKAGVDALEAVGEIAYFIHIEDKYICFDCQEKMFRKYVNNFVDPEIHWSLVRWSIGLSTEQDVRNEIADYGPENMANDILDIIGPCDNSKCPFGAPDIIPTIDDVPDRAHVNKTYINKYNNIKQRSF